MTPLGRDLVAALAEAAEGTGVCPHRVFILLASDPELRAPWDERAALENPRDSRGAIRAALDDAVLYLKCACRCHRPPLGWGWTGKGGAG